VIKVLSNELQRDGIELEMTEVEFFFLVENLILQISKSEKKMLLNKSRIFGAVISSFGRFRLRSEKRQVV